MGRPELTPEEWLTSDNEMIDWLTKHLARKGIYPQSPNPESRYPELLRLVHLLANQPNGQHEFTKLKSAWRRYRSDKNRGHQVVQIRLKPQIKKQLIQLSKSTSVSQTVETLIKEESNFLKNRQAAIKEAIKQEINYRTGSAMAQLDKTQRQSASLQLRNKMLQAELSMALLEIGNLLHLISEFEIAVGSQAGEDLGLSSSDKNEAMKRQKELLDYYTNRIRATASLPEAKNQSQHISTI